MSLSIQSSGEYSLRLTLKCCWGSELNVMIVLLVESSKGAFSHRVLYEHTLRYLKTSIAHSSPATALGSAHPLHLASRTPSCIPAPLLPLAASADPPSYLKLGQAFVPL